MCITAEENAPRDISEDACAHSAEANPSLDQLGGRQNLPTTAAGSVSEIICDLMQNAAGSAAAEAAGTRGSET